MDPSFADDSLCIIAIGKWFSLMMVRLKSIVATTWYVATNPRCVPSLSPEPKLELKLLQKVRCLIP